MSKIISTVFNPITKTIDYLFRGGGEFKAMNALGNGSSIIPSGQVGSIIDVSGSLANTVTTTANTPVDVIGSALSLPSGNWKVEAGGVFGCTASAASLNRIRIMIRDIANSIWRSYAVQVYVPDNVHIILVPFHMSYYVHGSGTDLKLSIENVNGAATSITYFYSGSDGLFDGSDVIPYFNALKVG
jgi:hypothetical protein